MRVNAVTHAASGRPHGPGCGGGASCLLPPSFLGCCEPLGPQGVHQLCGGKTLAYSNYWRTLLPQVNSQKCLLVSVSSCCLVTLRLGGGGGGVGGGKCLSFVFLRTQARLSFPAFQRKEGSSFKQRSELTCQGDALMRGTGMLGRHLFCPGCRPGASDWPVREGCRLHTAVCGSADTRGLLSPPRGPEAGGPRRQDSHFFL